MEIIMISSCTNDPKRLKRGCPVSSNKVLTFRRKHSNAGFTMAEAVVAMSLVAVAFTSTLAAFTRMNTFASVSRNYTGAYVAAEKRIDWILSAGPFNPQKGQIPVDIVQNYCDNTTTTVKLAPGTYTETCAAIYNDPGTPDPVTKILQILQPTATPTFTGWTTTVVTDVSPVPNTAPYIYTVTVTVSYQYRGRGPIWSPTRNRWEYQLSMTTLRTSDT